MLRHGFDPDLFGGEGRLGKVPLISQFYSFFGELQVWLALALATSFVCVALITPLVGRLARRLGAVADPGGRHIHTESTPRMGGLAIAVGALAGFLVAIRMPGIGAMIGHTPLFTAFIATSGIVVLGLIDDIHQVRPIVKLGVQVGLAWVCWMGGVSVDWVTLPLVGKIVLDGPANMALTILWIVGITNAINLLDGLDGLASGVSAIVTMTLMFVGLISESPGLFLVFTAGTLGAACVGFLVHNRHPARIFMGDTGSLFIGFLLANIAILTYRKQSTVVMLGVPILALGVPIADTVLAFSRRILQGRSPFVADRHHLHHVLHRIGMSRRQAVLIIYFGTGLLCAISLFAMKADEPRTLLYGVLLLVTGLLWLYGLVRRGRFNDDNGDQNGIETPVEGHNLPRDEVVFEPERRSGAEGYADGSEAWGQVGK